MSRSRVKSAARKGGRRYWWVLGGLLAVGVVANLIVWFRPGGGIDGGPAYTTYPEDVIANGRAIFGANCSTCHGDSGQGDAERGIPALDGSMHAWHHPDSQIDGFIRQGVGRMPAVGPDWSQEDITAVVAYVKQWWDSEQRAYQESSSRMNP